MYESYPLQELVPEGGKRKVRNARNTTQLDSFSKCSQ
jgi:hypothetical protein